MKHAHKDYAIRIWYSADAGDDCFVAQVADLPGIMAHGDTRVAAVLEIETALNIALESYAMHNEAPPAPGSAAAAELGRRGGKVTSARKSLAVRQNGRKGGRPRKAVPV